METEFTTEIIRKTFYVLADGVRIGHGLVYGRNIVIEGKVYSRPKAIKHLIAMFQKEAGNVR